MVRAVFCRFLQKIYLCMTKDYNTIVPKTNFFASPAFKMVANACGHIYNH